MHRISQRYVSGQDKLEPELHHALTSMNLKNHFCKLNLTTQEAPSQIQNAGSPAQKRLAEAFSYLERLTLERAYRQDPAFGKFLEERIIWRELLDLELQEIDENIGRVWDQTQTGLD